MLLEQTRLTEYFILFFLLYTAVLILLPSTKFETGALTLFSVNSFLYGFYIAPILSAQKGRIEELHRIVRAEANAIFAMVLFSKKLPKHLRNEIQDMFIAYIQSSIREQKGARSEKNYEQLITFCLDYNGKQSDEMDKLLEKLVANQQNRTNFTMQMSNKVYNNEWMIILILFSITLSFVLTLSAGNGYIYDFLAAFLCTGLTMLLLILVKMSTLTHKKARLIWEPYKKLIDSHFYRID